MVLLGSYVVKVISYIIFLFSHLTSVYAESPGNVLQGRFHSAICSLERIFQMKRNE